MCRIKTDKSDSDRMSVGSTASGTTEIVQLSTYVCVYLCLCACVYSCVCDADVTPNHSSHEDKHSCVCLRLYLCSNIIVYSSHAACDPSDGAHHPANHRATHPSRRRPDNATTHTPAPTQTMMTWQALGRRMQPRQYPTRTHMHTYVPH